MQTFGFEVLLYKDREGGRRARFTVLGRHMYVPLHQALPFFRECLSYFTHHGESPPGV